MNDIDKWEEEQAAAQLRQLKVEEATFAALPQAQKERILREQAERLEAFAAAAEEEDEEEEDEEDEEEEDEEDEEEEDEAA